ncbi:MAG: hypothetical protein L0G99_01065 [Propionibacteriales bacterium]|nr:hypothetical protein [Propionibacteriales bacterium]
MMTAETGRPNSSGDQVWRDPRAMIADVDALSALFARVSEAVQESLAQAVGEVRNENLFVRVVAGRVEALKVAEALGRRGLMQARKTVLAAFNRALVQPNRRGAAAVAFVPGGC